MLGLSTAPASLPSIPAELSPQDIWSIYDMPQDNMGQGQSIAILGPGDSSTTVKDLAIFESDFVKWIDDPSGPKGRTLFAATGDTGSSCPVLVLGADAGAGNGVANQGVPIVNYPAASPYVVAVGGTVLYPDGGNPPERALEYPWPYSGGGQSFLIAEPAFQQRESAVNRPCLSDLNGNPNTSGATRRGIPDVADESGDIATSSYDNLQRRARWRLGRGRDQPVLAADGRDVDPDPGGLEARHGIRRPGDLPDRGERDRFRPGWDYVSGWGTPVLTPFLTDVDGRTAPVR
ncbi:MAG TPA: hypothetical protein VMJ65_12960 [Solirubrobacteraceae bacterium]|nr:hypothetical protein [Solirubrobacteraceae bacterium]